MPEKTVRKKSVSCFLLGTCLCTWVAHSQMRGGGSSTPAVQLPLSGRQPGGVNVQQSTPAPSGASTSVTVQVQGGYAGSVPPNEAVAGKLELSLRDAVQRGLRANLGIVSANIGVEQSQARVKEARSALLPNLSANLSENAAKVNLAAEGFSADAFGGGIGVAFPSVVGPFHYYDLHGALQQSLLDITALRNLKTQRKAAEATVLQARQAREEVVLAVAGVYLQLTADTALLDRQGAEVAYAEANYKQAAAQAEAGNKAPIEANRSLVELQTEKQRLRSQTGEVRKRQIQLARLIGLPLGTEIIPKDRLAPLTISPLPFKAALQVALSGRQDLKASEAQLASAEQARKAASAQRLPSISVSGTYGLQGTNPDRGNGVFQATAGINVPIYEGGRISANVAESDAVVAQRRSELADQRASIEADLRNAYVDLQVANDQVGLADSNRKLATDTLRQSQDRFSVGVADSVEVVNSQQALATADHDYVTSLFAQRVASITLAHAMGDAEKQLFDPSERNTQ